MAPAFSKLSDPLRQLIWVLILLLSLLLLVQVCEAEKPPKFLCGDALDIMLFSVCKNGFNKKNLGKCGTNRLWPRVRNSEAISLCLTRHMLIKLIIFLFSEQMTDGPIRFLRSRRHADRFLLPLKFTTQFQREASVVPRKGKRHPSLKRMLKEEARWRRKHRITGKRLRRQVTHTTGIADECCSYGCAYSDIARYCAGQV